MDEVDAKQKPITVHLRVAGILETFTGKKRGRKPNAEREAAMQ